MTADRTPVIIAALVDAHHDAEDLQAAACLDRAVDLPALVAMLPISAADRAIAHGLRGLIVDGNDGAEPSAIACRVAARLAVTAVSLLAADPKRNLSDAEALWALSGKLSGLWSATADAMRKEERRRNDPMVNIAETYRLAAEAWKERAEKAETQLQDGAEATEQIRQERSAAAWDATQCAAALATVGAEVGITKLQYDPWDAAKTIIDAIRVRKACTADASPSAVQVGDIIDAKDVPLGTLVDRQTPDGPLMTLRFTPDGGGHHLSPSEPFAWPPWRWEHVEQWQCRVLAAELSEADCWSVARMTPSQVREWLAQRVAASPVR